MLRNYLLAVMARGVNAFAEVFGADAAAGCVMAGTAAHHGCPRAVEHRRDERAGGRFSVGMTADQAARPFRLSLSLSSTGAAIQRVHTGRAHAARPNASSPNTGI
jgi:hypothetical protein